MAVGPPDDGRVWPQHWPSKVREPATPRPGCEAGAGLPREAGGLLIPRDAASSRFQTVPQLSLSSVQTGSRQPERILS